jgi:beta-lactam-binding protein with PASTA domain
MMPSKVTVPDLSGTTLVDARAKLQALNLAVGQRAWQEDATKDSNTVLSQSPTPNARVNKGAAVDLVISRQPREMQVVVPPLVGKSLDAARQALEDRQLAVGNIGREASAGKAPNIVLNEFPSAGEKVKNGSKVDLMVSEAAAPPVNGGQKPPAMVTVPMLLKRPIKDAEIQLQQLGLSIGSIQKEVRADLSPGTVLNQRPAYGQQVQPGSKIDLTFSVMASCRAGYVFRGASPTDHVCVVPAVRAQALNDNAQAAARRAGGGSYGPDTCKQGYVWRDAFLNDHVCVTPATRKQAAEDNAATSSRIIPS